TYLRTQSLRWVLSETCVESSLLTFERPIFPRSYPLGVAIAEGQSSICRVKASGEFSTIMAEEGSFLSTVVYSLAILLAAITQVRHRFSRSYPWTIVRSHRMHSMVATPEAN